MPGSTDWMSDTACRSRLDGMLAADSFARSLGARLTDATADNVCVALDVQPRHTNFLGLVHGGVVYSLADIALSLISNAVVEAVALDTHLVLAASARAGERLQAKARPATRSRSVATYRITVERGDGRVIGLFTGTVFHREPRPAEGTG